jgi:hypothetical protein
MRTARKLEAELRQVLLGSVSTGAKEDESSTESVLDAVCHHVTARSRFAGILTRTVYLFNFPFIFGPRLTADNVPVDTGARLYNHNVMTNTTFPLGQQDS